MKIITSPAKLMRVNYESELLSSTDPIFIKEAAFMQSFLRQKSPKFLEELMEISPKLADENWDRNQKWTDKPTEQDSTNALFAFTGEVYRGLDAETLGKKEVEYLQNNYRILSGLYGILRPSDRVMLYRLEMGRPFAFDNYENIYQYWKEKVTSYLNSELEEGEPILNLASNEYGKVIDKKKLKGKWIDFDFYEMKTGKPKTIVVYTKHARGLVVRFCAENNIQNIEEVKAFNYEGYLFDEEKSTDKRLVFTR